MPAEKTPTVPALERGMKILETLAKSKNGYSFSQLVRLLDYPKSSIHSILITFERLGYLHRLDTSGRYVAGLNLMRIATAASHGNLLRQKASAMLCELTRRTGLTSHLAILEDNEALLVAKVEPVGMQPVATWIGKRIDYHCTSLGKALIGWLADDEIDKLVRQRTMLRHNENTICTLTQLKRELLRTRQAGYAVDNEEEEVGIRCIGAPVLDSKGAVAAAVSVAGTVERIPLDDVPRLGTLVRETASELGRHLVEGQ